MPDEASSGGQGARPLSEADLLGDPRILRSLLAVSSGLVYVYDLVERRNVYANQDLLAFLGYTAEEIRRFGSGLMATILHPEDRDRVARHHAQFDQVMDEQVRSLEYRVKDSDGRVRWLRSRDVVLLRGRDGLPLQILGVAEDITDRKGTEEELLQSERKFRALFESLQEGVALHEVVRDGAGQAVDYRLLELNPAFEVHTGLQATKVRGLLGSEVYGTEVAPYLEEYARVALGGGPITFETFFPPMAKHFRISVMSPRQGQFATVFEDITARKRDEEELRASEARFRSLFNNAQVGMFRTRLDGSEILELNDKYLQILGKTREEVAHRPSTLVWADPGAREEMVRRLQADGQVTDFEMSIAHSSGRAIECVTSIKLFRDEGILEGSLQDVSGQRQAEAERLRLQAQLQQTQKMESLGTLSGGIAHDMNNVLGAILGLASANLDLQPPGSPAHRSFDTIAKAAARGGEMVRGLLAFARQRPSVEQCLDVNALLREETHLLERTTLARVRLVVDLEPDLRHILGDAGALTHVFMNLCVNAVEAMPENGVLTLRTRNLPGDRVEVAVEDSGSGMPVEVLNRAMEPFFTTKEVGKGTGLGLSMVYSTVKAHRGEIDISSSPGHGTQVRMRFPACESVEGLPETSPGAGPRPSMPPLKVLVVDDDELIQSSMGTILQTMGHEVLTTPGGEQALAAIEAGFEPDVVILDMNMPGLGGIGTLSRLRSLLPCAPVLLSSGRTDQSALDLARAHQFVTLLPKPFTIQELQRCLESLEKA